jgi:hypothetical protein
MATLTYDVWVIENGQRVRRTVTEEVPDPPITEANRATIAARLVAFMATNDTYAALDPPTNNQMIAQMRRLTRQNQGLIRLVLSLLDSTDGTA